MELQLKKLAHYQTRFTEHFKAIAFAQKKKKEIQTQVHECLNLFKNLTVQDFRFLDEIAALVVRARRALTYTYAIRFYL